VRAVPGSPAAQAGLRGIDQAGELGDVIVSANGQPARRLSDLTDQLEAIGVGREIELSVKRKDGPSLSGSRSKTSAVPVEMRRSIKKMRRTGTQADADLGCWASQQKPHGHVR
jgi:S1-C subfamily serine protease